MAKETNRVGEPDFRRIGEEAQLLIKASDGSWPPHDAGVDSVIAELLPLELQDFFVMDADEAADYVGGSENKVIKRQDVHRKNFVCRAGVARPGVCSRQHPIEYENSRWSSDGQPRRLSETKSLAENKAELDLLRTETEKVQKQVEDDRHARTDIEGRLRESQAKLETLVGNIGAHDELKKGLTDNRIRREKANNRRRGCFRCTFEGTRCDRSPRIVGNTRNRTHAGDVATIV